MKVFFTLLLSTCTYKAIGQDIHYYENVIFQKLNSHIGWFLNVYKENGKVDFIYNSYAHFYLTPDYKLVYSYRQVVINDEGDRTEASYKEEPIKFSDIKSFELQETFYEQYISKNNSLKQEKVKTPFLVIHYVVNGKSKSYKVGFEQNGDSNVVRDLNEAVRGIQKIINR